MSQFRYFPTFPEHANLRVEPCAMCGRAPTVPAVRLHGGAVDRQSVCADCLAEGKAAVQIPKWIIKELEHGVSGAHPDWSAEKRASYVADRVDELAHTPPIHWLQNNEWPVCDDDFAAYERELSREVLEQQHSDSAHAREALRSILLQAVPNWEQDEKAIEAEWSELGNFLAVFEFRCLDSDERRYVVQTA